MHILDDRYLFNILIANKVIEIDCHSRQLFAEYQDYITDLNSIDFSVSIPYSIIISKANKLPLEFSSIYRNVWNNVAITRNIATIESFELYKCIAEKLIEDGFILIHGAAIAVDKKCYLFLARSGVGKTTHIMNWIRLISGSFVVNGDKPLINVNDHMVYGTPWSGKEHMDTNTEVRLDGLIWLERGSENIIESVSFQEILPTIVRQTYIPKDSKQESRVLKLIGCLADVPCYHLKCNQRPDSAIVAYEYLSKKRDKKLC